MLLIGSLGLNFSQIVSAIYTFEFKRMYLKMSSVKWREICLCHYVLICFLCWSINPIKIFADISKTALNLCKYALGLRFVVLCVCVCVVQILSHISMNLECRLSFDKFLDSMLPISFISIVIVWLHIIPHPQKLLWPWYLLQLQNILFIK